MNLYKFPKCIKAGDTIGVIAPSSSAKRKLVETGINYLRKMGYKVKSAPNISRGKFYIAGDDKRRVELIEKFFLDPEVDAIFCVRGGYGILRILDKIDYGKLAEIPPKMLVGYSDVTALQMALLSKLGWVSFSGPMVASEMGSGIDSFTERWLWRMVSDGNYPIDLVNPEEQPVKVFRHGYAEGTLLGGCLSLITPILDTDYMPPFEGAVLVIEDIDERTYRLDKQFQILRLHNVFDKISGLIIGEFKNCFPKNPKRSFALEDFLKDFLGDYNFPIITDLAYGHIKKRLTLPLGARVQLTTKPLRITLLN